MLSWLFVLEFFCRSGKEDGAKGVEVGDGFGGSSYFVKVY